LKERWFEYMMMTRFLLFFLFLISTLIICACASSEIENEQSFENRRDLMVWTGPNQPNPFNRKDYAMVLDQVFYFEAFLAIDQDIKDQSIVDNQYVIEDFGIDQHVIEDQGLIGDQRILMDQRVIEDQQLIVDQQVLPVSTADYPSASWRVGTRTTLPNQFYDLPGIGTGNPVITSNNPELFEGPGLLYGNARATQTRGGERYPLSGRFGIYLHHLNRAGRALKVSIVVSNPNANAVTVNAYGSIWTQQEAGGVGLQTSPDYRVSQDWLRGTRKLNVGNTQIPSLRPLEIYSATLSNNHEIDGRIEIFSSADVYTYLVVSEVNEDLNTIIARRVFEDAPGDYRISGNPPPPFGRTAGIYEFDRYLSQMTIDLPAQNGHLAWIVNTAIGLPYQSQAFRALTRLNGSNPESVGMYGNVYEISFNLNNPNPYPMRINCYFGSLSQGQVSRYWDGLGRVDGLELPITHTPNQPYLSLKEVIVQANSTENIRFEAMVPGLASIPQTIWLSAQRVQ
jgi:hypothetical protein